MSALDKLIQFDKTVAELSGFEVNEKGILSRKIWTEAVKDFTDVDVQVNRRKVGLPSMANMCQENGKLTIFHPLHEIAGRGVSPVMAMIENQSQVWYSQLFTEVMLGVMDSVIDPKYKISPDSPLVTECGSVDAKTAEWLTKILRAASKPNEKKRIVPILSVHISRQANNDGHPVAVLRCRLLDELESAVQSRAKGGRLICGCKNVPMAQVKALLELVRATLDTHIDSFMGEVTYSAETGVADYFGAYCLALEDLQRLFGEIADAAYFPDNGQSWPIMDAFLDVDALEFSITSITTYCNEIDPQAGNGGREKLVPREPDVTDCVEREFSDEGLAMGEKTELEKPVAPVEVELTEEEREHELYLKLQAKYKTVEPDVTEAVEEVIVETIVEEDDLSDLPPWERNVVRQERAAQQGETVKQEVRSAGNTPKACVITSVPTGMGAKSNQTQSYNWNASPVNRSQGPGARGGNNTFDNRNNANRGNGNQQGGFGAFGSGGFNTNTRR